MEAETRIQTYVLYGGKRKRKKKKKRTLITSTNQSSCLEILPQAEIIPLSPDRRMLTCPKPFASSQFQDKMECSLCHDLQGVGEYIRGPEKRSRHFVKLFSAWGDLEKSAETCENCSILVRGCRGCLHQHGIQVSQISHCHITFFYSPFEDEDQDVDKEIFFRFENGSWFTVQVFTDPDGEWCI